MAIQYHELPADLFPAPLQPRIKRLNRELRDLFGLEGALRDSGRNTRRSDLTVTRQPGDLMADLSSSSVTTGPILSVFDGTKTRNYRLTLVWLAAVGRPQIRLVEVV